MWRLVRRCRLGVSVLAVSLSPSLLQWEAPAIELGCSLCPQCPSLFHNRIVMHVAYRLPHTVSYKLQYLFHSFTPSQMAFHLITYSNSPQIIHNLFYSNSSVQYWSTSWQRTGLSHMCTTCITCSQMRSLQLSLQTKQSLRPQQTEQMHLYSSHTFENSNKDLLVWFILKVAGFKCKCSSHTSSKGDLSDTGKNFASTINIVEWQG